MTNGKKYRTMCSSLLLSVVASAVLGTNVQGVPVSSSEGSLASQNVVSESKDKLTSTYNKCGLFSQAVANEEKVIEMLKKEGIIPQDATLEEAHKAYMKYMSETNGDYNTPVTKAEREIESRSLTNLLKDGDISFFDGEDERDKVTEINVLTMLVQYSDYSHNSIKPDESDMYYSDYTKQHYQDLLFGDEGYKGPDGKNYISMKQFYEQESGGSFIIDGTVTDWYTVPNTAAYYGGEQGSTHDLRPRELVADGLKELAKDKSINLGDFDKLDRYDSDGDGDYNEPDGMIDYLIVIHAGVGQEAGGGSLGTDAIWSHSWSLGGYYGIPGTSYTDEDGNVRPYYAYKYTIDPEDGAAGVFSHETGHEIGLPDEYDTRYSSASGEPISYWSLMSSGSWTGAIPGTEPSGISAYCREMLQNIYGGKWNDQTVIDYSELDKAGVEMTLNSAAKTGESIRVNLPDLETVILKPTSGSYVYYGGKGKDEYKLDNSMTAANLDLTNASNPVLKFKTNYDIELGWDFASVLVKDLETGEVECMPGNITTTERDPGAELEVEHGITGTSNGWVDAIFDLSKYAGKKVDVVIRYQTDAYTFGQGIYIDDLAVVDGDSVLYSDDVESDGMFTLDGFTKDNGISYSKQYYLVEWRDHSAADSGLAHIAAGDDVFEYDEGMLVWYVNELYTDNWGGIHPGYGYLSIVDADQTNIPVFKGEDRKVSLASNKYQMHDAVFSKRLGDAFYVDLAPYADSKIKDWHVVFNTKFSDSYDYSNKEIPSVGVVLPKLDLNIEVVKEAFDETSATIKLSKGNKESLRDRFHRRWNDKRRSPRD